MNVSFSLKNTGLLTVVGEVGCGKSTLLYSLINETYKLSGEALVIGKIAFVEQEPFILSGTVIENVIFGLKFD